MAPPSSARCEGSDSSSVGFLQRDRPSRRTLVLLVGPIVVLWIVGTIANALTPWLLSHHPLALIWLEPRNRNLVAASPRVDTLPFVVAGVVRRVSSDPLFFIVGHLYGEAGVRWIERKMGEGGVAIRWVERWFKRASWPMVFLFPGALVCVLAGATGMGIVTFAALNLCGTIAIVVALRVLADHIRGPVDALLRFNDRNVKWLTIASIVLVLVWLVWQRRQGSTPIVSLDDVQEELEQ